MGLGVAAGVGAGVVAGAGSVVVTVGVGVVCRPHAMNARKTSVKAIMANAGFRLVGVIFI